MGKKSRSLWLVFLGMLAFLSITAGIARSAEEVLFSDEFDSFNIKNWGPQPATGVTVQNGTMLDKPQTGQTFLSSLKKFRYVTFETRIKFNKLSTDSTIFYYIGLQSVTPWCYNVCWATIQDSALFASANKDGEKGIREHVADLKEKQWYTIKIVWTESAIEFYLDGEKIYKTDNKEVIPEGGMPVFLAANTLGAVPADMEVDWVTVRGEVKK